MKKIVRAGCQAWIFLLSAACAANDSKPARLPSFEMFQLGSTTYSQVVGKMGEPNFGSQVLIDGKTVKSVSYSNYVNAAGEPVQDGAGQVRSIHYYFSHDVLVGEHFKSPIKAEIAGVDESKVDGIKKGQATRADVVQLLGRPIGAYIAPMASTTAGDAVEYRYVLDNQEDGGVKSNENRNLHELREVRIGFDDKDLVSSVFKPGRR